MFTSITSYLFGDAEETLEAAGLESSQPNLKTTPADNEWVLVDKSSRQSSPCRLCVVDRTLSGGDPAGHVFCAHERIDCNSAATASRGVNVNVNCSSTPTHSTNTVFNPPRISNRLTDSVDRLSDTGTATSDGSTSSPEHVVYPSLEESWLVTPPPCFTAGGSSLERLETNPMENLLIEHPSMSVYGPRGRPSSTGLDSEESSNEDITDTQEGATSSRMVSKRHPPHRPRAVAARAGILAHVQTVKAMQNSQRKIQSQRLSKHKLARTNKVREQESRCKNPRRKQLLCLRPSRVSTKRC